MLFRSLGGKDPKAFEKEVKEKFIKQPEQMKLLIVVDKLLTGFDAPPATYLYIDKSMRDHGLFQAICRVNRLDGEDKEFGYIIDYKDLFRSLENAVADYTSEAFDSYLLYSSQSSPLTPEDYLTLEDRRFLIEDFKGHLLKTPGIINECLDAWSP